MIKLKAWGWPVWPKHVAWYNYQTNKGVLTEWFYTKLLQNIGMNNYKFRLLCVTSEQHTHRCSSLPWVGVYAIQLNILRLKRRKKKEKVELRFFAVKVKCTLVQALRLCTDRTAHRGSRGIALLFHDHGTRRGWGVSVTPRPLFTPRKDPVPIVQESGWALGPVWTGAENLAPPPPGFDPRTVQPVASLYTDWAIRPTFFAVLLIFQRRILCLKISRFRTFVLAIIEW